MKKTVIRKNFFVVVLTFSMLFHMTVPVYAGNGTVSTENMSFDTMSLVRYNVQSDISEVIEIPTNELLYPNIGTHSLLDEETRIAVAEMENGGAQTYEIIGGVDDRDKEIPATSAPFSGLVLIHLWTVDASGTTYCKPSTGFLVAPNVIVTAAHCVIPDGHHTMTAMYIYSGVSAAESSVPDLSVYPHVAYNNIEDIYYPERYLELINQSNPEELPQIYDWAIITLKTSFSGYIFDCYCTTNLTDLHGMNVAIAGYPDDKKYWIYHGVGNISITFSGSLMAYDVDTTSGQSGAPVYRNSFTEGRKCYGIHTSGSSGANFGKLFVFELYNAIAIAIANAP